METENPKTLSRDKKFLTMEGNDKLEAKQQTTPLIEGGGGGGRGEGEETKPCKNLGKDTGNYV
jgi:hypothetical protein